MRTGTEIKVGLITVLAIVLVVAYTFYVREFRARAATYTVNVTFDDARGLQRGDQVRMVGVKIGEVRSVEISPSLKAAVELAIYRQHALYSHYKFQIATSGIIQERFVEVIPQPQDPYAVQIKDGGTVEGITTPGFSQLLAAGGDVLENLNRTSRQLNVVLADQQLLAGVRQALRSFSTAASAAAKLAESTAALTEQSQPEILATLKGLKMAVSDLRAMSAELRAQLAEGAALEDLQQTAHHAREAAANAERVTAALAELTSDAQLQQQVREAVSAVHEAAESAKRVGEDLEVFSGELREVAPAVPKVAQEVEKIAGTTAALRDRLKPPEINAAFDVLYSSDADHTFPSARLDLKTSDDTFLRFGIDDIGEESDVSIQLGERQRSAVLRYGLFRSSLGVGFDFDLPRDGVLSVDLFDPNEPRADILADVPLVMGRPDWRVVTGFRDVGDDEIFVGGIRLKR
jgi:phospholipid/cholesterol/gamma-HCH transport system substrate-binding protein